MYKLFNLSLYITDPLFFCTSYYKQSNRLLITLSIKFKERNEFSDDEDIILRVMTAQNSLDINLI